MPASKAKHLSSLIRSATKRTTATPPAAASAADDATLKNYVSSLDLSSPPCLPVSPETLSHSKSSYSKPLSRLAIDSLKLQGSPAHCDNSTKQLSREITAILCGEADLDSASSPDSEVNDDEKPLEKVLDIPWFSNMSHNNTSLRRKEVSRERKQKWVYKGTQTNRIGRLVSMCANKVGADATLQVFGKLGRETGVKEFNALIGIYIAKARSTDDEDVSIEQIQKAYMLFKSMKEQGFPVEEETYGPFLLYLIEMENYLIALCGSGRKREIMLLLETIDITQVSSLDSVAIIFKSLGRLLLEAFAKKFILALKTKDIGAENISNFIYDYAISMPNLAVKDVVSSFKNLHTELEIKPSSVPYEKLIRYCCDSLKLICTLTKRTVSLLLQCAQVHVALDTVDQIFEAGLGLSIETFNSILDACDESCDYNLVCRIYSLIRCHSLKPNNETFRSLINLFVKMKDFDGAYGMIDDLEKMNLMPSASMYNAIMAGYFREKNIDDGLMVLKQMEKAGVRPNSQTFSYLISNCSCEEDIIKCYEELKHSGVQVTKHVFMALINAYAACGKFEKAKQVVSGKGVPAKSLNEIKSVLVSALASHGKMSDALHLYEEMKKAECNPDPRAIKCLIEHLKSEGELSRLLHLLKELEDSDYWVQCCCRVMLYCVRHKHLSSVFDLVKQLKDKLCYDEEAAEALFDEVFCQIAETEPSNVQIGLDLLQAIKEDFGLHPSRKTLDFLLSACVKAKDLQSAFLIWKEYQTAGLPYNVLSFLRMYQALLASGDHKSASDLLIQIPKDDPHVLCIVKACQATYRDQASQTTCMNTSSGKRKKKKKKKGSVNN
ncbi:hypothetical protein RJ640_004618 [Escallonia rubra]|uniref:PROP1-like PPR domain-containing protein n=1 Tax=Escallonia rubra TaxID=112253 RepID=A0AA88UKE2_9ASTE|nr:hypothetical protein RJ640_004618 [Escallonia rubra]